MVSILIKIQNKYKKSKIQYNRRHKEKFQRIQEELQKETKLERTRLGSIDSIDLVIFIILYQNIAIEFNELSKT